MSPPELQRAKEKNPTLELIIISANDVSHTNVAAKMDVYAVVSITGRIIQKKQAGKTPIDFYGGSNPTWNHTVKFSVNEEATLLTLKVKLFSFWLEGENDLYLGEVNVSVQELLALNPLPRLTNGNDDIFKLVTYPVKITEGIKGKLRLSYRFKPAAPVVDLYNSASVNSLSFDQQPYSNPNLASSGHYPPQFETRMTKLTLELVIKSAKDIKSVGISNEMNVYALVMIREGKRTIKDTTNTPNTYCTYKNPRWDHKVEFLIDEKLVREGRLKLVVKLIAVRLILGETDVGEVQVPIQELFEFNPPLANGDDGNGMILVTRSVMYSDRVKGTFSFTYRFLGEQTSLPVIMYPIRGTSGYAVFNPEGNAGPSNGQMPNNMQPQQHQLHGYQHFSQPQPQPQSQPMPQKITPIGPQPPVTSKPQGENVAALGLGAAILGRVIGGALIGEWYDVQ